ncbi:ANTAR domain-containing protein [Nocardia sp. KC 131]|uniref:ANTAR domain-containing protein n=1 Tax=Nocardia arseniciresistens TaxID=3392119 RepID=UPI00398F199A
MTDRRLADTFVVLAGTLRDSYDIPTFLTTLADRSFDLLGVGAAAVLIEGERKAPQTAAADPRLAQLELDAAGWKEGPGTDCHRTGTPLAGTALGGPVPRHRWPRYAPRAEELGYTRVAALPLRHQRESVGALVLLWSGADSLDPDALALGQALADAAAIALIRERELNDRRKRTTQLEGALSSRVVIEQAKGILSARRAITMTAAFDLLRGYARSHQRLLVDVALEVVQGRLSLE